MDNEKEKLRIERKEGEIDRRKGRERECCDHCHCPAPFTYFVWKKGNFHPFPLTVGI